MTDRIYLDHAATSPILPEVAAAMEPWIRASGNPSSLHQDGRRARQAMDAARETVATELGCEFGEVIFTSSGTEAANLAIVGAALAARAGDRKRVLASAVEHHCVLNTGRMLEALGFRLELVSVDRQGRVRLDALERAIDEDVLLVSLMHANNELGTIQPIEEARKLSHRRGSLFHADCVQTFTTRAVDIDKLKPDMITISAHKIGGPQGIGAVYIRAGTRVAPLVAGGAQEREMRAGTENVAAAVGFAEAIRQARLAPDNRKAARDGFLDALVISDLVETVAAREEILDGHAHLRAPGVDAETVLILLDRMGVSASSGAACSSGSLEPSHVLLACGYSATEAREGLRFTFGRTSSVAEAREGAARVGRAIRQIRDASA